MQNIVYYVIWAWNFVLRSFRTGTESVRNKWTKTVLEVKFWTAGTKREITEGFPINRLLSDAKYNKLLLNRNAAIYVNFEE
jgi:hypothetical protein